MEGIKEFLQPEFAALAMLVLGAIVLVIAIMTTNKVSGMSAAIDEFKADMEKSIASKFSALGTAIPSEINKGFGKIDKQLTVMSDSSRDSLHKSVNEIVQEINDFKNDQLKSTSQNHEGLLKKFSEQALHLQDRVHNVSKENAENFNVLQERIRKVISTGIEENRSDMIDRLNSLSKEVHGNLDSLIGMVGERLNERFQKTNSTIENLTERLNAIDSAQERIQTLSADVVNLSRVVADRRARGVMGDIQLTHLVGDTLSKDHYETDVTLPNGAKASVLLKLPDPTGKVGVYAGLSLDNYSQIGEVDAGEQDIGHAREEFGRSIREAVETAGRLIHPPETSGGSILFVPSESAFAEIHAHHRKTVEDAFARNIWIVSPTTMMALLNMARSIIKDVATRQEVRRIRDELIGFQKDFREFGLLVENLVEHIGEANKDIIKVQTKGGLISERLINLSETADIKLPGTQPENV